jgi:hypothetical protein
VSLLLLLLLLRNVTCKMSDHRPAVTASGWWPKLKAVQAGRVALVDGNQMFNRPGERPTASPGCVQHQSVLDLLAPCMCAEFDGS